MKRWLRAARTASLCLPLAVAFSSCGGSGGGATTFFFGTNGNVSCDRVVVEVDLDPADAVVARLDDAVADCALSALLDTAGCEIEIEEVDRGDTLSITIEGCTIPPVSVLFACGFRDGDAGEIGRATEAACRCESAGCDATPPVCVSEDDDAGSCEDCENETDDDGNGLEDCEDRNCEHAAACEPVPTTTTSTTTSSSSTLRYGTTTTMPVTTTTLSTIDCTVTFRLVDDVTVGALQWVTNYEAAPGNFLGDLGTVECESLVPESIEAFNDRGTPRTLESGLISVEGIDGPTDLVDCTWRGAVPEAGELEVLVTSAATVDLVDITPLPDISVIVECAVSGVPATPPVPAKAAATVEAAAAP